MRHGNTEKRDRAAERRHHGAKHGGTEHGQQPGAPHRQSHRSRVAFAEQQRVELLGRCRRDQHAEQRQRTEQLQSLPRDTGERSESPLRPLREPLRLAGPDEDRDDGRHGIAEHQAKDQYRRRVGDAARDDQDQSEHQRGADDCRGRDERVATDAGGRVERRRRAVARTEHDESDAEAGSGGNAERERIRERIPEQRLHL